MPPVSVRILLCTTLAGCALPLPGTGTFIDEDQDGFYRNAPAGQPSDCDDLDASTFPGAPEICDGIDNDCNRRVDDDAEDALEWFVDADGDGHGFRGAGPVKACRRPQGYAGAATDCNDNDRHTFPGAPEACDGLDNDCDRDVDEGIAEDAIWYFDADGDGFGSSVQAGTGCSTDPTWTQRTGDCNDAFASVNPRADEVCDGLDNDCDGLTDDFDPKLVGGQTSWLDADGDGYGAIDVSLTLSSCTVPDGYVTNDQDCDDADAARHPETRWWLDADLDGTGDPTSPWPTEQCWQPIGYIHNDRDCDDDEPGSTGLLAWYPDADGDGFGTATIVAWSCAGDDGWSLASGDCNDRNASIHPDAEEICDNIDNDCSGSKDDDDPGLVGTTHPHGPRTWFTDADGDGWGVSDGTEFSSCALQSGRASIEGDCDETDPVLHDGTTWYLDADGDGHGDPGSTWATLQCESPGSASVYVTNADDCDDADAELNDFTGWFHDADDDGIGVASDFDGDGIHDDVNVFGCIEGMHASATYGDCDDFDDTNLDDTCTGGVNEGLLEVTWTADADPGSVVNGSVRNTPIGVTCVEEGGDPADDSSDGWVQFAIYLGAADAQYTGVAEFEVPTGLRCYLTLRDRTGDPSQDGTPTLEVTTCDGQATGVSAWSGDAGTSLMQFDTTSFIVPDCSGCTDAMADNYSASALIDDGSCSYAP